MKSTLSQSLLISAAIVFSGCGQAASAGADGPSAASLARFQPREDGWQNDPANQPHPNDSNPLRRKLGDSPIVHGLFGKPDVRMFEACVRQHNGLKPKSFDATYSTKCPTLQSDLLQRARSAGFGGITADNVLDPHFLPAQGR